MTSSLLQRPLFVGEPLMPAELAAPAHAKALVVIVHADTASLHECGQRFIADVLQAQGFATLSFSLRTAEEEAAGHPAPGIARKRDRVRSVLDEIAASSASADRRVALLGTGEAVPACIAAAARFDPNTIGSLMLLDGRPDRASRHLARLQVPTLFIVGAPSVGMLNHYRAAARVIPCPHRLQVLRQRTRAPAAPGAHEAVACAATAWLVSTLQGPGQPTPSAGAVRAEPPQPSVAPLLQPAL